MVGAAVACSRRGEGSTTHACARPATRTLWPPTSSAYTWLSQSTARQEMASVRRLTAILAADVAG